MRGKSHESHSHLHQISFKKTHDLDELKQACLPYAGDARPQLEGIEKLSQYPDYARFLFEPVSPNGVKTLSPAGAIKTTGTWNLGTRAGDFIFIAGMRGIDPATNQLIQGDEARIRQGFLNMKLIAESEGATLRDATRLVVYVTDMFRFRPLVNKVQEELWGQGPYPPRTIIEVHRLNQDDIFEVEGTFYAPVKK